VRTLDALYLQGQFGCVQQVDDRAELAIVQFDDFTRHAHRTATYDAVRLGRALLAQLTVEN
jgi:hypothetical protein